MPKPAAVPDRPDRPDDALDLGRLTTLIGFRLRMAQLTVYEDFLRDAPAELTPGQLGILVLIDRNPDMTQQRLCEQIRIDKSTLALTLDRLADRGLLRRIRSKEDRRRNMLRLTTKGQAAHDAMLAHVERHERRVFGGLSGAERATLLELLARIGYPEKTR
jgi:DNA-binding MarR family transcriptional regulator